MSSPSLTRTAAARRLDWLRRSATAGTLTLAMLHGDFEVQAQAPRPLGREFRVNTFVNFGQVDPAAAMDPDGDFVVTWRNRYYGIFAQRYEASGESNGDEFEVSTNDGRQQYRSAVAMDSDGDFVVAWNSYDPNPYGKSYIVFAQRFDASGTPQGEMLRANTASGGSIVRPAVDMADDGDFVIAWQSGWDGSGSGIAAQWFSSDGTPQGDEVRVNTFTDEDQARPAIAMDPQGGAVAVWQSGESFLPPLQDRDNYGIFAQRYAPDGTALGDEFQVNSHVTFGQRRPAVSVNASGQFVVAWASDRQDGDGDGIFAQRFAADGTPIGEELQINTYTTGEQSFPSVALDDAGGFVVAWESEEQDGSGYAVIARQYTPDGLPVSDELRINVIRVGDQRFPVATTDAFGNFAIVWESNRRTGFSEDVYARLYARGGPVGTDSATPETAQLAMQVYPNPASGGARLQLTLPRAADVRLELTDLLGRSVRTLPTQRLSAGSHEVALDLTGLPGGMYALRLQTHAEHQVVRLTHVR